MAAPAHRSNPLQSVRETCSRVCGIAKHVKIRKEGIEGAVRGLRPEVLESLVARKLIDTDLHFMENNNLTVQYLLVLDSINFCFWPDGDLEYEHLAKGLKAAVEEDPNVLNAKTLTETTGSDVQALMRWPREVPLQEERARLIREVGFGLLKHFNGEAAELVLRAERSAATLADLLTRHFPGFRDQAVYRGAQVFLYKRAQIFVGDVCGAFGGQGLGRFDDIGDLTMFADYRVPVMLKHLGVLEYSEALEERVRNRCELAPSSEEEVEIRCSSIMAVEALRQRIQEVHGRERTPHSVQLDWWLWETAEASKAQHPPHHRTLTIFY